MLIFGIFIIYPAINNFNISVYDSNNGRTFTYVGGANYNELVGSEQFWMAARATLIFASSFVVLVTAASIGLALLLDQKIRGLGLFRAVFFLPVLLSPVVVGLMWGWIFDRSNGMANNLTAQVRNIAEVVTAIAEGDLSKQITVDARGEILVVLGVPLGDVRARHAHLRAHRAQVEDLLLAHLVGHDDEEPVALAHRDERERETGIPCGCFYKQISRRDFSLLLRGLHHRQRDAVLDRTGRIGPLALHPDLVVGEHPRQADVRRVADRGEDVGGLHGVVSLSGG